MDALMRQGDMPPAGTGTGGFEMTQASEKYAAEIEKYVREHRQELVDILIEMIGVPSVKAPALPGMPFGENCAKALEKGMEVCRRYGMQTECYDNYAASARCGSGDKEIGFIAHLDVVPVSDGWSSDPFTGIERDGFVVGRGSRDNKAGFAAALMAVNCVRALDVPLRSSLRILMGSDEECGMSDMVYVVKNCPLPDFSVVTDCYFPVAHGEKGRVCGDVVMEINTEKLRMEGGQAPNIIPDACAAVLPGRAAQAQAVRAAAASFEGIAVREDGADLVVEAQGVSAHASEPFKAVNAIHRLAAFLADAGLLEGREARAVEYIKTAFGTYYGEGFGIQYEDGASGKTTLIPGVVRTQDGALRVTLDSRYSVTDKKARVLPLIASSVEEAGWRFEVHEATDSHYIPGDHPVAQRLTEVFNAVTGEHKKPYVLAGGTYASKVPNSVAFGPGNAKEPSMMPYGPGHGDAHQPDESQHIGCLMDAVRIYALGIIELDDILHAAPSQGM